MNEMLNWESNLTNSVSHLCLVDLFWICVTSILYEMSRQGGDVFDLHGFSNNGVFKGP